MKRKRGPKLKTKDERWRRLDNATRTLLAVTMADYANLTLAEPLLSDSVQQYAS